MWGDSMAKKKTMKPKESVAAQLMEKFMEDGKYPLLKQTEGKIKKLTTVVREELESSEAKRHLFKEHNLVGKFIAKKVYETDYIALNEYLYDIGLLLQVAEIDNEAILGNVLYFDIIQDFKLPDSFYIKPNFNKLGKAINRGEEPFALMGDWELNEVIKEIAQLKPMSKELKVEYKQFIRKIMKLPEIEQMKSLPKDLRVPIPYKYGSISLVANKPKYDIPAIYEYIGEWLLIEYGKPNSELLERFIMNGTISKKDIEQFRTLKDIRLDFTVMTLEDEQKLMDMLDDKNKRAAANRMGA